ncbi:MAG: hypothetical protein IEMM0006_0938 [bacterium]|nr:MAG: hypothetical protein IEMM0006_0938 [bacterium]
MDKREIIDIANRFAAKVAEKYDCVGIVLFGSYAKGSYHKDSDIDIAVILKDFDNLLDIQLELMRLRRKIDSRIEPHPIRESDFNLNNPLANEIKKYGKPINIGVAREESK